MLFLAQWFVGDVTNLVGASLKGQSTWQKFLAGYYIALDVGLCCQYVWYTCVRPQRRAGETQDDDQDVGQAVAQDVAQDAVQVNKAIDIPWKWGQPRPRVSNTSVSENGTTTGTSRVITRPRRSHSQPLSPSTGIFIMSILCVALANASPIHILSTASSTSTQTSKLVGDILAWISAISYLASRIPQIRKNMIRKSTAGLAPALFIAAFCGNLLYSSSLAINPLAWHSYPPYGLHGSVGPEGSNRKAWINNAIPFFVGTAGVLLMDFFIIIQFLIYSKGEVGTMAGDSVGDSEGRGWRRANGWMRGWVPTPTPSPTPDDPVTVGSEHGEVRSGVSIQDGDGRSRWLRVGGLRGWILNRSPKGRETVESESETDPLVARRNGKRRETVRSESERDPLVKRRNGKRREYGGTDA